MTTTPAQWNRRLAPYATPDVRRSVGQLATTLCLFAASLGAAFAAYAWLGLAASLPLSAVAGLLTVRLFVIQHDCGHRSFLPSASACDWVGRALSVLTVTPYGFWRRDHDKHHATSGHLDKRGFGDIKTLTVGEYRALPLLARLRYRAYRHPLTLFLVGPSWQFLVRYRLPFGCGGKAAGKLRASILGLNAALAGFVLAGGVALGFGALAAVWLPAIVAAATVGVWLFFVQHAFEETYWERQGEWSYVEAALHGCSFYRLPGWLHWMTGWIGYHHIHHLSARIPNYNLPRAYAEIPELREASSFGFLESLSCARLALWCEERKRLISFREARPAAAA